MERKLVTINTNGPIPELNYIAGPIMNPSKIPIPTIIQMIKNNREVKECDPSDPRNEEKKIILTLNNVKNNNFSTVTVEDILKDKSMISANPENVSSPKPEEKDIKTVEANNEPEVKVEEPKVEHRNNKSNNNKKNKK